MMDKLTDPATAADTLEAFLAVWGDGPLLNDIGPHLTCAECDALANLLRAHGAALLEGHACYDVPGDSPEHLFLKEQVEAARAAEHPQPDEFP